jgi:hypothetical protein
LNRVPKRLKNAPLILGILFPKSPPKKIKPQKKPKENKSFSFMTAAFDVIEDVFDEVLD